MSGLKKYLNRQECSDWLVLFSAADYIGDLVNRWKKAGNITSEESRKLNTVKTLLMQVTVNDITSRLRFDQKDKLCKSCNEWRLMMVPTRSSKEYQEFVNSTVQSEGVWVNSELFDRIAEEALAHNCCPCKLSPEEVSRCPFREAFLTMEVPVYNDSPADGVCPYNNDWRDES